jgi:methionyl-tRNA formyltransferase
MIKKIDKGSIIYQKAFSIKSNDSLFKLYQRAYQESIGATLEAIRIIKAGGQPVIAKRTKPSYYRFPTAKDWKKFWQRGYQFI